MLIVTLIALWKHRDLISALDIIGRWCLISPNHSIILPSSIFILIPILNTSHLYIYTLLYKNNFLIYNYS